MQVKVGLDRRDIISFLFDGYDTAAKPFLDKFEDAGLLTMLEKRASDDLCNHITPDADVVATALSEAADAIERKYLDPNQKRTPVKARIVYQIWSNHYTVDVDESTFDCSIALDEMELADIENVKCDTPDYDSDDIFYQASDMGLCKPWDGPFSLYIDDEEEFASYLEKRRAALEAPKKVFISAPMSGKSDDEIKSEHTKLLAKASEKAGRELVEIQSFKPGAIDTESPLSLLGAALQMLAQADYVVFSPDWQDYRGCRIEHECAVSYGVPILEL